MFSEYNVLDHPDQTNVGPEDSGFVLFIGLGIVAALLMTDIVLDILGLYGKFHLWFEAGSLAGILGLMTYVYRELWKARATSRTLLGLRVVDQEEILRLNSELTQWQEKNESILQQFSERFEEQCQMWGLTDSESDIARALLKGRSLKGIAHDRGTSQATVRQQASEIYKKTGLQGRAELSAWFLNHVL